MLLNDESGKNLSDGSSYDSSSPRNRGLSEFSPRIRDNILALMKYRLLLLALHSYSLQQSFVCCLRYGTPLLSLNDLLLSLFRLIDRLTSISYRRAAELFLRWTPSAHTARATMSVWLCCVRLRLRLTPGGSQPRMCMLHTRTSARRCGRTSGQYCASDRPSAIARVCRQRLTYWSCASSCSSCSMSCSRSWSRLHAPCRLRLEGHHPLSVRRDARHEWRAGD